MAIFQSENKKFLTDYWCVIPFLFVLFFPAITVIIAAQTNTTFSIIEYLNLGLRILYLSQIGIVVYSSNFFGREYDNNNLYVTLVAVPKRTLFLINKLSVVTLYSVLSAILSLCVLLTTVYFLPHTQIDTSILNSYFEKSLLIVFCFINLAFISGGITVIAKTSMFSISMFSALFFGVNQLLHNYFSQMRFSPDLAVFNVFALNMDIPSYLSTKVGMVTQSIWMLTILIVGIFLFVKRDLK